MKVYFVSKRNSTHDFIAEVGSHVLFKCKY